MMSNVGSMNGYQRSACRHWSIRLLWTLFIIFIVWNVLAIRVKTSMLNHLLTSIQDYKSRPSEAPQCPPVPKCPPIPELKCPSVPQAQNSPKAPESQKEKFEEKCYKFTYKNETTIEFLEDLMDSPRKPRKGESVMFTDTSCAGDSGQFVIAPK